MCRTLFAMPSHEMTPLGALLEEARKEVLRISASEAARRAQMSESRWRQVVTGVQRKAGGTVPVNPTARTVVAMADAVGVEPLKALGAAGFRQVSAESVSAMRQEVRQAAQPASTEGLRSLADEIERIRHLRGISADDKIRMVNALVDLHEERSATSQDS